jgi:hypothetical protein
LYATISLTSSCLVWLSLRGKQNTAWTAKCPAGRWCWRSRSDAVGNPRAAVVGIDGAEAITDVERCRLGESPGKTKLDCAEVAVDVLSAIVRGIRAVLERNTNFVWALCSGALQTMADRSGWTIL